MMVVMMRMVDMRMVSMMMAIIIMVAKATAKAKLIVKYDVGVIGEQFEQNKVFIFIIVAFYKI